MVGAAIVPFVKSFVEAKISDLHWRSRKKSTYTLRSVLNVPTFVELAAFEFLLNATKEVIKDTTPWSLSGIFEFLHNPANGGSQWNIPRFVDVLLKAINIHEPDVAEKICGAMFSLSQGYEDVGANYSLLIPYPAEIIQYLIAATEHSDGQVSKLRVAAAYDILNVAVRCTKVAQAANISAHLASEIFQEIETAMHIPLHQWMIVRN